MFEQLKYSDINIIRGFFVLELKYSYKHFLKVFWCLNYQNRQLKAFLEGVLSIRRFLLTFGVDCTL